MNFLRLIMTLYTSIASLGNRLVRWLRSPRGMMRVSIGIIVIGGCWQARLVWRETLVEQMAKRRGDVIERATLIPYSLKQYMPVQIIVLVEPIIGYRQFGPREKLTPAEVRQLSGLTCLRNLELERVDPEAWPDVGRLRNVTSLRLGTGTDLRESDFRQIVRLKRLRRLELRWTNLDVSAFEMLAEFPCLQDLTIDGPREWRETNDGNPNGPTRRALHCVELTPTHLTALASLPNLQRLHLRQLHKFGNEQLITMTSMLSDGRPPFPSLESLELEEIGVYGPGLSQFKNLPRLRHLNFQQAGIGDDGIAELRHVRGLRELFLRDCYLSPTGVVGLSKLRNLEHLATTRMVICDEGARAISSLQNLKTLSLQFANVSDSGATHFTRLKNLESLNLSGAKVSRKTAIRFGELKRLKYLWLPAGTPPETVVALTRLLPKSCHVWVDILSTPTYCGYSGPPMMQLPPELLAPDADFSATE